MPKFEGSEANFADFEEDEEVLLMTYCDKLKTDEEYSRIESEVTKGYIWLLDLGSDEHLIESTGQDLLMAQCNDTNMNKECIWFLDSGCSTHMCGNKKWFFNFDEKFRETVKVGDGRRLKVEGRGSVRLEIEGKIQVVTDVIYVPELRSNLLNVGQLQQKKVKVIFEDDKCEVHHKQIGLIMISQMTSNRMFPIKTKPVEVTELHGSHCREDYRTVA